MKSFATAVFRRKPGTPETKLIRLVTQGFAHQTKCFRSHLHTKGRQVTVECSDVLRTRKIRFVTVILDISIRFTFFCL